MRELHAAGKKAKKEGHGASTGGRGGKALSKSDKVAYLKKSLKVQKCWISMLHAKIWKMKKGSDDDRLSSSNNNLEGESTSNRGHPALTQ